MHSVGDAYAETDHEWYPLGGAASDGADLYTRCPYVVVGHRHPSGIEGLYLARYRDLCRILQTDFGELAFHALG